MWIRVWRNCGTVHYNTSSVYINYVCTGTRTFSFESIIHQSQRRRSSARFRRRSCWTGTYSRVVSFTPWSWASPSPPPPTPSGHTSGVGDNGAYHVTSNLPCARSQRYTKDSVHWLAQIIFFFSTKRHFGWSSDRSNARQMGCQYVNRGKRIGQSDYVFTACIATYVIWWLVGILRR